MTSWNKVLRYVKNRMSLPSTFIEKNDTDIKEYLIETALSEFSTYMPDTAITSVLTNEMRHKVPTKNNHYYFFDDEDLDIITIKECYFNMANEVIAGHPVIGPMSMESMKWFALAAFQSKFFSKFSDFKYTYKFIEPNIVHVLPGAMINLENFAVEYEREQPKDLSKIPKAMEMSFMDLCLAHTQIWIGGIRSHYGGGNITTPFGDIPLNGAEIKSEGNELRERIVQRLSEESVLPFIIDVD